LAGGPPRWVELLEATHQLLSEYDRKPTTLAGSNDEGYPGLFPKCAWSFYEYIAAAISPRRRYSTFADGHRDILLMDVIPKA